MYQEKTLPSQEYLKKLLCYDNDSGKLFWRRSGKEAGSNLNGKKRVRRRIGIRGRAYMLHRIVWKWYHGNDPEAIDHIDGNPLNNRISNLRNVDQRINLRNQKRRGNNTSGVTGVSWHIPSNRWIARISTDSGRIYLGLFESFEEAVEARKKAELNHSYHENHDRDSILSS